jgi:hypothetical protein
MPHWLTHSEVVRATSPTPEGPYTFREVVLPARGAQFWDGRMTHNPTIHRRGDTYMLYYTGTTYTGPTPTPERPCTPEMRNEARANQRIGLATAPSPAGPWTRRGAPVLEPRPGKWDGLMTTNPAPCVLPEHGNRPDGPDGSGGVLLVYKSAADQRDLLRMGVARAADVEGPYERLTDGPIFRFDDTGDHVEDAYVWHDGTRFQLIMKDMRGGICGERGGGIHATSDDGVHWTVSQPAKAYSRAVRWDDGTVTTQHRLERPQVLVEDGVPTCLFLATSAPVNSDDARARDERTWTIAIPLRRP